MIFLNLAWHIVMSCFVVACTTSTKSDNASLTKEGGDQSAKDMQKVSLNMEYEALKLEDLKTFEQYAYHALLNIKLDNMILYLDDKTPAQSLTKLMSSSGTVTKVSYQDGEAEMDKSMMQESYLSLKVVREMDSYMVGIYGVKTDDGMVLIISKSYNQWEKMSRVYAYQYTATDYKDITAQTFGALGATYKEVVSNIEVGQVVSEEEFEKHQLSSENPQEVIAKKTKEFFDTSTWWKVDINTQNKEIIISPDLEKFDSRTSNGDIVYDVLSFKMNKCYHYKWESGAFKMLTDRYGF